MAISGNGRWDHPRSRLQRYVRDKWGEDYNTLSQEDREIARTAWQTDELVARLSGRNPRSLPLQAVIDTYGQIGWPAAIITVCCTAIAILWRFT